MSRILNLIILGLGLIELGGCTQLGLRAGIERADDLGLQLDPGQLPPLPPLPALSAPESYDRSYRDGFVELWMARSDLLCRQYKDKIILVSRDTRFATHATTTILSGLATIFTAVGTIHPLTGAATIVGGVGAAAETDTFEQQSGEIIASAIQTSRENQANQIEGNLKTLGTDQYNIYRAQRDVIDYHNMCSLETALAQVRSSLKATSPNQGNLPPAAQGGLMPVPPTPLPPPAPPSTLPPAPPPPAAATTPLRRPTPLLPSAFIGGAESPAEKNLERPLGRRIQAALCLPQTGNFGQDTRDAIQVWRFVKSLPGSGALQSAEIQALLGEKACDLSQYRNTFERFAYPSAFEIKALQRALAVPESGQLDKPTRDAIRSLQHQKGQPETGVMTPELEAVMPRP